MSVQLTGRDVFGSKELKLGHVDDALHSFAKRSYPRLLIGDVEDLIRRKVDFAERDEISSANKGANRRWLAICRTRSVRSGAW
jgi:hypothetical protein